MSPVACIALLFAALVRAQGIDAAVGPPNPVVDIRACNALSCNGTLLCDMDDADVSGVGMTDAAISVPGTDTQLSLTLVDGYPRGVFEMPGSLGSTPNEYSTHGLFVGAPSDFNLSAQPPLCALMLQYQAQTFPAPQQDRGHLTNTTSCPESFAGPAVEPWCLLQLDHIIKEFQYDNASSDGGSLAALPRCVALAQWLQYRLNSVPDGFCFFFGNLISVTGGAITGPDVANSTARPDGNQSDCQPVLPQSYQLYAVTNAMQNLYNESQAAFELGMGGRVGFVPVVAVQYSNDTQKIPSTEYYCMQAYAPDGGPLPSASLEYEGAASKDSMTRALTAILLSALAVSLL